MINKKVVRVLTCIEKIGRDSGKDEFEARKKLEKTDIWITNEKTIPFRENQIAITILLPFSLKNYNVIKSFFIFQAPEHLIRRYIQKIKKKGKSYLRFPYSTEISTIDTLIFEQLNDFYEIEYKYLTKVQWKYIQHTEQWKFCQRRLAKELIANEISNKLGLRYLNNIRLLK